MYSEFSLAMRDKTNHFVRSFVPDSPRAIVIVIHGKGEHGGRYINFGNALENAGFAVYMGDLRGHGQTEGKAGHTAPRKTILDDIDELITYAKVCHPGLPIFMYGHSMGGNIALSYRQLRDGGIKAFIISSPWLQLIADFSDGFVNFVTAVSKVMPKAVIKTGIDANVISSQEEERQEYLKDKKMNGVITLQTASDIYLMKRLIYKNAPSNKRPFMLLHGTDDRLVNIEGSRRLYELSKDVCLYKEYEDCRHEILHDFRKDEAIADMTAYLNTQL